MNLGCVVSHHRGRWWYAIVEKSRKYPGFREDPCFPPISVETKTCRNKDDAAKQGEARLAHFKGLYA